MLLVFLEMLLGSIGLPDEKQMKNTHMAAYD